MAVSAFSMYKKLQKEMKKEEAKKSPAASPLSNGVEKSLQKKKKRQRDKEPKLIKKVSSGISKKADKKKLKLTKNKVQLMLDNGDLKETKLDLKQTKEIKKKPKSIDAVDKRVASTTNRKREIGMDDFFAENGIPIDSTLNYTKKAMELFEWMMFPTTRKSFFSETWETKPLHVARNNKDYFKKLLTSSDIDLMLRENPLYFGRNVDVVKYENGERITENPAGRAKASIVWDAYSTGHSIRILNPQTYNEGLHVLVAGLQEYFGAMVGVNVYLTPAGSQGFAPHYDDIEAFVLQLEGRKHWKLYEPNKASDVLARYSSNDYNREEIGEPLGEITLEAGDVLYFPRGVVHEAKTDDGMHSLHITVSTYQRNAYIDLLEKVVPDALSKAAQDDVAFRNGLPPGYLKHLGVTQIKHGTERTAIIDTCKQLISKIVDYADFDAAADQLGRRFMYEAMPPVLEEAEKECSSKYDGDCLQDGQLVNRSEIEPDTEIRLLRMFCIRLVVENDETRIYYCTDNAKVYQQEEEQYLTIDSDTIPVIEKLLQTYPNYITVDNLPHEDLSLKISLITELWDYGIVVTKEPLGVEVD